MKLTPQPITSPVVNVGPYAFPVLWQQKDFPSSPWYAQLSGSQPGNFSSEAFRLENPIPIMLSKLSTASRLRVPFPYPSLPLDIIVTSK